MLSVGSFTFVLVRSLQSSVCSAFHTHPSVNSPPFRYSAAVYNADITGCLPSTLFKGSLSSDALDIWSQHSFFLLQTFLSFFFPLWFVNPLSSSAIIWPCSWCPYLLPAGLAGTVHLFLLGSSNSSCVPHSDAAKPQRSLLMLHTRFIPKCISATDHLKNESWLLSKAFWRLPVCLSWITVWIHSS